MRSRAVCITWVELSLLSCEKIIYAAPIKERHNLLTSDKIPIYSNYAWQVLLVSGLFSLNVPSKHNLIFAPFWQYVLQPTKIPSRPYHTCHFPKLRFSFMDRNVGCPPPPLLRVSVHVYLGRSGEIMDRFRAPQTAVPRISRLTFKLKSQTRLMRVIYFLNFLFANNSKSVYNNILSARSGIRVGSYTSESHPEIHFIWFVSWLMGIWNIWRRDILFLGAVGSCRDDELRHTSSGEWVLSV